MNMCDFANQNQKDTPEEISILEAIYGEDIKWENQSETNPDLYEILLVLKFKSTENSLNNAEYFLGNLSFLIDYSNESSPKFLFEANDKSEFWGFYQINLDTLKTEINRVIDYKITELEGQNIIFPCYQAALDTIESLVKSSKKLVESKSIKEIEKEKTNQVEELKQEKKHLYFHLIFIDHMRDYKNYFKTLNQWTSQLNLNGHLIQKNTLNGEMIKNVYLILKGELDSLSEFSKRLKTQNIDVDSKGKPCKEKMSRLLLNIKASESELIIEDKCLNVFHYKNEEDLKSLIKTLYVNEVDLSTEFSKLLNDF